MVKRLSHWMSIKSEWRDAIGMKRGRGGFQIDNILLVVTLHHPAPPVPRAGRMVFASASHAGGPISSAAY